MERVARIGKNNKYKLKVDEYHQEKNQEALGYSVPALTAYMAEVELSGADYCCDKDDVEAEFSMLKYSMIKDGTYFEEPRIEISVTARVMTVRTVRS